MSILSKYPTITRALIKIFETPKGFIINGIHHDKQHLRPTPFKMFETYGHYNNLHCRRSAEVGVYPPTIPVMDSWLVDDENPNITYIGSVNTHTGGGVRLRRVTETVDENGFVDVEILEGDILYPDHRVGIANFLGQSKDRIFFSVINSREDSEGTGHSFIFSVRKSDLGGAVGHDVTYRDPLYPLWENADSVFVLERNPRSAAIVGRKINKVTGQQTSPFRWSKNSTYIDSGRPHAREVSSGVVDVYTLNNNYEGPTDFKLVKTRLNLNGQTAQDILVSLNQDIPMDKSMTVVGNNANRSSSIYKLTKDGDDYFLVTFTSTLTTVETPQYLIKIINYGEDDESHELVQTIYSESSQIRMFLPIDDAFDRFITQSANELKFYKWDSNLKQYRITGTRAGSYIGLGVTNEGVVMATTREGILDVMDPVAVSYIDLQMDQTNFLFENEPIETHCKVATFNLDDEMVKSKVKLVCSTGAKFTLSDSRSIEVTTSAEQYVDVGLTITSGTNFTITPSLLL